MRTPQSVAYGVGSPSEREPVPFTSLSPGERWGSRRRSSHGPLLLMTVRICSRAVSTGTPLSWLPSRKRKADRVVVHVFLTDGDEDGQRTLDLGGVANLLAEAIVG